MRSHKLRLYFQSIRYLKTTQLFWRLYLLVKSLIMNRSSFLAGLCYGKRFDLSKVQDVIPFQGREKMLGARLPEDIFKFHRHRADLILNNTFEFLQKTAVYNQGIEWQDQNHERLWLYNLHYFEYLFDLGICYLQSRAEEFYAKFKDLVVDWIENNPVGRGIGWQPYPVSIRIVNWLYAYAFFREDLSKDRIFRDQLLKSLHRQVAFLSGNLEYHLLNNHLIKNGKALLLGGLFFRNDRWVKKGRRVLLREVQRQILEDGGHFERSPMYHLIVLQDLMETYVILRDVGRPFDGSTGRTLQKMVQFIYGICQPDGEIPLFNDAAFRQATPPFELITVGQLVFPGDLNGLVQTSSLGIHNALLLGKLPEKRGNGKSLQMPNWQTRVFPESGYYVLRDKDLKGYLIVDCGELGPDFNPGHGHADALSYELSIDASRMIVDSGESGYSVLQRDYFRSTQAHNTVVIDGYNQAELWDQFRVAERPYPICTRWVERDHFVLFEGQHDGFSRLDKDLIHNRRILQINNAFWLFWDDITGGGEHRVESYIHFHPRVTLQHTRTARGDRMTAHREGACIHIFPVGSYRLEMHDSKEENGKSWYADEFGKRERNSFIVLQHKGFLPVSCGYLVVPGGVENVSVEIDHPGGLFQAHVDIDGSKFLIVDDQKDVCVERRY